MEAMIKNDDEKVWMMPLLELRNELGDFSKEAARRDYRRMSGRVQLFHDGLVRGPYTKEAREYWLRRVLAVQTDVRRLGPADFADLELISIPELHEIRRIWLYEKHEFDDRLPVLYEEIVGEPFPAPASDDRLLRAEDWSILQEACDGDPELFQLQASLLDIEREYRGMSRRAGIYEALEERLRAGQYGSEAEALAIRQEEERRRDEIEDAPSEEPLAQRSLFDTVEPE